MLNKLQEERNNIVLEMTNYFNNGGRPMSVKSNELSEKIANLDSQILRAGGQV